MKENVRIVIDSLQPDMVDFADNEMFMYWMNYGDELADIAVVNSRYTQDELVSYLNHVMRTEFSTNERHHAATDVAQTLETLYPATFANVFVY
jgi:hypothetical protein